jgi:hypothetical protein
MLLFGLINFCSDTALVIGKSSCFTLHHTCSKTSTDVTLVMLSSYGFRSECVSNKSRCLNCMPVLLCFNIDSSKSNVLLTFIGRKRIKHSRISTVRLGTLLWFIEHVLLACNCTFVPQILWMLNYTKKVFSVWLVKLTGYSASQFWALC